MTSNAVLSQGTSFHIQQAGTNGTAKNVTAVTKADPAVVTSTAHGLASGSVVKLASLGGMVELNGHEGPVRVLTADTFELVGVDSTAYTTYTTGGTATPVNWLETVEHKSYSRGDAQSSDIDVTTMKSDAKEYRNGLQDFGNFTAEMNYVESEAAQVEMKKSLADSSLRWFKIIKRNGYAAVFQGTVKGFSETGGVDGSFSGSLSVRISGVVHEVAP